MGTFSNLIKELLNEISSADDLKTAIEEYQNNSAEVEKLQKSIKETVDQIKKKSNESNQQLKLIFKFMEDFNVSKVEGDKWVAELAKIPKFTYPSTSHKELWETALAKVNLATKKVLLALENAQLDTKRKMQVPALKVKRGAEDKTYKISENIIEKGWDWVKEKLGGVLKAMKGYKEAVSDLPEIPKDVKESEDEDFKAEVKILDIKKVLKVQDILQDLGLWKKQPKSGYSDVFVFFDQDDYIAFTDSLDDARIEYKEKDLSSESYKEAQETKRLQELAGLKEEYIRPEFKDNGDGTYSYRKIHTSYEFDSKEGKLYRSTPAGFLVCKQTFDSIEKVKDELQKDPLAYHLHWIDAEEESDE